MIDDKLEIYRAGGKVAIKGATWTFKGVDKSLFADEFEANPVKAKRDYGAEPPEGAGNAIPMPELIDAYSNTDRPDPVDASLNRLGWVVPPIYEWFRGDPRFNYFLHLDLSKSGDQTGLGLVHYDHYSNKFVADLIMKIPVSRDWNLKFKAVKIFVDFLLSRGFFLSAVTFDGFQSLQIIQDLKGAGVNALQYSVDRSPEAYDTLIATIFQQRFDYYYQFTFCEELKAIQLIGNKYDHPIGGSKDVSDGVAGALAMCVKSVTAVAFSREDLSTIFIQSKSTFSDSFQVLEDGVIDITDLHSIRNGSLSSFYLESYEDILLVMRGYLEERVFYLDYIETFLIDTPNLYEMLLNMLQTFRPNFVGLGASVSFHIVDLLRQARVRMVAQDTNRLDNASNRDIRIIRKNVKETIENLVSQVKQKSFKVVDRLTVFNQLSELSFTNYSDKLLVTSMAAWLHYMLQETKKNAGSYPRAILGGTSGISSVNPTQTLAKGQNDVRPGGRPRPKMR